MKAGQILIRDGKLVITCQPHVAIKLRRVFGGAQRYKAGLFMMAATPSTAHDLEWFRQRHPFDVDPASREKFDELVAVHTSKLAMLADLDRDDYIPREFDLALPPREYQRFGADMAIKSGSLLLADVLGSGKTVTAICTFTAPDALPALVVTMTHLTRQWEREIARFAPKLRVHRIKKTQPYEFKDVRVELGPKGKRRVVTGNAIPDVIVTSYSKLNGWADTLAGMCRTVVFDEGAELRHDGTKKYEAAAAIAERARVRLSMTATPVFNYGAEIYNVISVIAPDQLGSRKEFFDEWCGGAHDDRDNARKARVSDPVALGTYLREAGLMLRRTLKDIGRELPALTVVPHTVEADPESINRASADIAELAQRVLDRIGSPLERAHAATELDWRLRQATGIAKAPAVADFVRVLVDAGEPVVLFGWHREVYAIWQSIFSRTGIEIPFRMYTGSETDTQKAAAVVDFIAGKAKILIVSLRSGAGLDGLQKVCRTTVHGELDWSPAVHQQGDGRVHRDGQERPVMAYYLTAEEGSDPVILDVLGVKESQAAGIRDPETAGEPVLVGAPDDRIRQLAEDVIRRRQQNAGAK